eukprot:g14891.t1
MTETKTTGKRKSAKAPDKPCQCIAIPKHDHAKLRADGVPITDKRWHEYVPCGELTRSEFAVGHDAKLKGALIRAYVAESPIWRDGKKEDPYAIAKARDWTHFLDAARAKAEAKAKAAEAKEAEKAKAKEAAAKKKTTAKKAAAKKTTTKKKAAAKS